jgi:cytoskeletal protein CcmA (bactofilin family)
MAKNNDHKGGEKITTVLGKETSFDGILRFRESLKIDGKFEGQIESPGFLYIENGAVVKADIKVGSIVIGGVVHGNVEATERLEMLATGRVVGNIRTAKLNIADGVVFQGKCEMIRSPESLNIFSAPVQELKKAAQSV